MARSVFERCRDLRYGRLTKTEFRNKVKWQRKENRCSLSQSQAVRPLGWLD